MPAVVLHLPEKENGVCGRPSRCPSCQSQILQRWGKQPKILQDKDKNITRVPRYRCCDCGSTFRVYPNGVDRSGNTRRIRRLAAALFALGISSREIEKLFKSVGIHLSHSTIWRQGRELVGRLESDDSTTWQRVYTIDSYFIPRVSNRFGVVLGVDFGQDRFCILGTLDEFDPRKVKSWIQPLVGDIEVEISTVGTGMLYQMWGEVSPA